jgi:outer membrane protein assembly factor BamB
MSPSQPHSRIYIGIASSVVALRKDDGSIEWSRKLPRSSSLVALLHEGPHVFALSSGEVSCLDAATGEVVWHNPLKGFGRGWALIAGGAGEVSAAAGAAQQAQAAQSAAMIGAMAAVTASSAAAH